MKMVATDIYHSDTDKDSHRGTETRRNPAFVLLFSVSLCLCGKFLGALCASVAIFIRVSVAKLHL